MPGCGRGADALVSCVKFHPEQLFPVRLGVSCTGLRLQSARLASGKGSKRRRGAGRFIRRAEP